MAGSISYRPFTIFSMPRPSIGLISRNTTGSGSLSTSTIRNRWTSTLLVSGLDQAMLIVSARDFSTTQKGLGCAEVLYNKGFAPTPEIRRG